MASITFTADQSLFDLFTTAACAQYGYKATLPDGTANPQTSGQFAQQVVINFAIEVTKAYQAQQAAAAARQAAIDQIDQTVTANPVTVTATPQQ